MLGYPLLKPSQQLTRTMGRTMPGQRAPGLHGFSNRSVIFSRALHTPQALSLTLFPCGLVWAVGCCVGFSQVHVSSSQWEWQEFSRAARVQIVQSMWELKEQSASLRHFLRPQSPVVPYSSVSGLILLNLKNLPHPKLQMKEEYRIFSL